MPGKYSKVQLRKGLAKHVREDDRPAPDLSASSAGTGKDEEDFLLESPPPPPTEPDAPARPA